MPLDDDLNLEQLDWDTQIHLGAIGTVQSYKDLAPLLDELSKRFYRLDAHVSSFEPPAAGFTEIAVSLTWVVDTTKDHPFLTYAALRFIDTLLEDGARKIRREMARITREARINQHGRRFVPFEMNLGPVKFLFHRPADESKLIEQIAELKKLVAALPVGVFVETQRSQFANWFSWDSDVGGWRRVREGNLSWWPKDLWEDQ